MKRPEQGFSLKQISDIYQQAFNDLIHQAHTIHKQYQEANKIHVASILNIKTGACPEDCGYCSQSGHHQTDLQVEKLMPLAAIIEKAKEARAAGATRFCIGAAWRFPPAKAMPQMKTIIEEVKKLGLETCATLGMLNLNQAEELKEAGLDYYNHNIDTSPSYYAKVVTTRTMADRLNTLSAVREADIKVCCGGIMGMGETREDRIEFLQTLANLPVPPESVPINQLIPVPGTPLANSKPLDSFELVRTIATARIIMPQTVIRLTAGRTAMSEELQALCFYAGANSVFIGSKLLTKGNPDLEKDQHLFAKLGLESALTC